MVRNDEKRSADVAKGMVTMISSVVSMFDLKKESELKAARREILKVAGEQIEKLKATAEVEIGEINNRAAAERKIINDRVTAERKIVREKVNAEMKLINEELDIELKKIDDLLLQQKLAVVKGVTGVIGPTGVLDNLPFWGNASRK